MLTKNYLLYVSSTFFAGAVAFAILPLTTLILNPEDYGAFALVTVFMAVGGGLSGAISTFLLNANYQISDQTRKKSLISTTLAFELIINFIYLLVLMGAWTLVRTEFGFLDDIGSAEFYLALAAMMLAPVWSIAQAVLVLKSNAAFYSSILVGQTIVRSCVVLGGLFVFQWGLTSLFAALLAANLLGAIGGIVALRNYLCMNVGREWLVEIRRLGPLTMIGGLSEMLYAVLERSILATFFSLNVIGLVGHAQQYGNTASLCIKAWTRTVQPISLEEARTDHLKFEQTQRYWKGAYLLMILGGIFFACFAEDIIRLLTNDKFTSASTLAVYFYMVLLISYLSPTDSAIITARSLGRGLSRVMIVSTMLATATLAVAAPVLGMYAAVAAVLVQRISIRIGMTICTCHLPKRPQVDHLALAGVLVVGLVSVLVETLSPDLSTRLFVALAPVTGMTIFVFQSNGLFARTKARPTG